MYKPIGFLILIIVFVTGCIDEYDDGPFISLRSHYGRLKGTWDLEYLIVGDIDSTSSAKNQPCYGNFNFTGEDDIYGGRGKLISINNSNSNCFGQSGNYNLSDDSDDLILTVAQNGFVPIGSYRAPGRIPWKILRLTGSQLWLENNYNNLHCWMHLKKN